MTKKNKSHEGNEPSERYPVGIVPTTSTWYSSDRDTAYDTLVATITTIISPGMGTKSFFLKRSLRCLMANKKTRQARPRTRAMTLVLAMSPSTALRL